MTYSYGYFLHRHLLSLFLSKNTFCEFFFHLSRLSDFLSLSNQRLILLSIPSYYKSFTRLPIPVYDVPSLKSFFLSCLFRKPINNLQNPIFSSHLFWILFDPIPDLPSVTVLKTIIFFFSLSNTIEILLHIVFLLLSSYSL